MSDPFELLRRVRPADDGPPPPLERLWERLEQALEPARVPPARSPGRRSLDRWRTAAVTAILVAICVGVTVGVVGLLSSGRTSPTTSSLTPTRHGGLKAILGVLREPPTTADRHLRGALAPLQHLLRGRFTIDRTDARVAATVPDEPKIVLVPVIPSSGGTPQLATTGGGGSSCCMTVASIENGTATGTWGGAYTKNYGMIVVPDEVARVEIQIGRTLSAAVHDNVAVFRLSEPIENLGLYPMTWLARSGAVVRRFQANVKTNPPPSHPRYPARIYPPPVRHPHWGQPGDCASLAGVRQPGRSDDSRASGAVLILLDDHLRAAADRAYWPMFAEEKRARVNTWNVLTVGPATRSPFASLIRTNCGDGLVTHSIRVVIGPPRGQTRTPALTTELWVINRGGRWLVWWSQN